MTAFAVISNRKGSEKSLLTNRTRRAVRVFGTSNSNESLISLIINDRLLLGESRKVRNIRDLQRILYFAVPEKYCLSLASSDAKTSHAEGTGLSLLGQSVMQRHHEP